MSAARVHVSKSRPSIRGALSNEPQLHVELSFGIGDHKWAIQYLEETVEKIKTELALLRSKDDTQ